MAILLGAAGLWAAPAQAQTGATAPAYPGNTLTIADPGTLVAGTVVRVKLSGHAQWKGPTDDLEIPYEVSLYVQDADVDPHCSTSYSNQLTKSINLPGLSASNSISGFVMQDSLHINPNIPEPGLDWAGESLPFNIAPGHDNVILCGFVQYVIDDVAYYELPIKVVQPSCRPARSTVKQGSKLELRCNVSGPATVRFSGPRKRTLKVKLPASNGRVKVSTGSLRAGSYRVTVAAGEMALGGAFRVRVR